MSRILSVSVALILTAGGVASAPPLASAAMEGTATPMCHGKAATIVGHSERGNILGTEGSDVIVSKASTVRIDGLGGADLICVSSKTLARVFIVDGAGNDLIDARSAKVPVSLFAIDGDDTFFGSPQHDSVSLRGGHDIIRTFGGADTVSFEPPAGKKSDTVDLGDGADLLYVSDLPTASTVLDGGPGHNLLTVAVVDDAPWTFEAATGRVAVAGRRTMRWPHFTDFDLQRLAVPSIAFRGSGASESVDIRDHDGIAGPRQLDIRLGGGDDRAQVSVSSAGTVNGGAGRDRFGISGAGQTFADTVELTPEAADFSADSVVGHFSLARIQDLRASMFREATITGNAQDNLLQTYQNCLATLNGAEGNDTLVDVRAPFQCNPNGDLSGTSTLNGGSGNDTLIGANDSEDTLDGGDGNDTADGRGGIDTCYAETRTNCEAGELP
ncbi:MAG: hypothetical protein WC642_13620 [Nocardioides sp.]|jgi:Ca2+-binding RTX toxin-like protein